MEHTGSTQVITIRLELPASVPLSEHKAREILVLKLVEDGYLSQSEGARLLGVSRAELIERMTQAKMAVARYTPEDLARETETLHWLQQQRAMSNRISRVDTSLAPKTTQRAEPGKRRLLRPTHGCHQRKKRCAQQRAPAKPTISCHAWFYLRLKGNSISTMRPSRCRTLATSLPSAGSHPMNGFPKNSLCSAPVGEAC